MDEITLGIVGCVVLLGLFTTGIELAFAMAIIGVAGYALVVGPGPAVNILANDFYDALESYSLTVVPLFVLMGQIAFNAGIAKRLYDSAHRFLGHIPGGLAMATVAGATVFKAICGSQVATCATFASVAVPEMDRFNYSKKLSTGIVATVGTLGVLIPPQCNPYHTRDHHSAVHRKTLHGGRGPRAHARLLLSRGDLRVGAHKP